jgi:hypothetical protein
MQFRRFDCWLNRQELQFCHWAVSNFEAAILCEADDTDEYITDDEETPDDDEG